MADVYRGCMWRWFVVELCGYGYSQGVMWQMFIVDACGGGLLWSYVVIWL